MQKLYRYISDSLNFVFIFSVFNDNFTVSLLGTNSLKLIIALFIVINLPHIIRNFITPGIMSQLFPFFIFLSLALFSMLIGLPSGPALTKNLYENSMLLLAVVVIMIYFINYDFRKILWFVWTALFISSIIAFINDPITEWTFRKTGGTGDPNEFASQMLSFLFISIFLFNENKKYLLIAVSAAAFVYSILFAGSMSSFLTLFVLSAMIMMRFMKMSFAKSMIVTLLTLTGVVASIIIFRNQLENIEIINNLLGRTENTRTAGTRFYSWDAGLRMISDKPLTGVGMGQYTDYSPKYSRVRLGKDSVAPHNLYIEIMAESGLIVFLAFVFFMAELLSRNFGTIVHSNYFWLYMAVISYLLMGMTIGITYEKYFWLFLALLSQVQLYAGAEAPEEIKEKINIGTV